MKIKIYLIFLTIMATVVILTQTDVISRDLIITYYPSLISYIFLGAIPFLIKKIKPMNLIPMQIILFGLSLMLGGHIFCSSKFCEMAELFVYVPIPFILATLIIWILINVINYFVKKFKK